MSRMRCRLGCEKPDDIEYTLHITMAAKDWEKLREQLQVNPRWEWPASEMIAQITDMLAQARKIYWPAEPPEPSS